jgi:hypothetical protein
MIKPIPPIENLEKPVTKPAANKLNNTISNSIPWQKFWKKMSGDKNKGSKG